MLLQPLFFHLPYRYHWDYTGSNADQGLLHHWVRYMKMNYSQILIKRIETWAEVTHHPEYSNTTIDVVPVEDDEDDSIHLLAKIREVNSDQLSTCTNNAAHLFQRNEFRNAPFADHVHFAGGAKPWNKAINASDVPLNLPTNLMSPNAKRGFWLYHLARANETLQLGLPATITVTKGNPFAAGPRDSDILDPKIELPV